MKKLYFLITAFMLPFIGSAQSLTLFATDALGNRDTVQIGLEWQATIGVDSALNEVNIFGVPADSVLEMRVIQRDSANHLCLMDRPYFSSNASPLYFPENLDLKIDNRNSNFHTPTGRNFQIWVRALHYPVLISADPSTVFSSMSLWADFYTIDSTCTYSAYSQISSNNADSLALLTSPEIYNVVIYLDHEVSRPELREANPWQLVQNPVSDRLILHMQQPEKGNLQVLDGLGRIVRNFSLHEAETEQFTCSDLPAGMYYVRLQTPLNPASSLRKLIKQ